MPFDVSFEGREDTKLKTKLADEMPGILNWAIQGCLAWQSTGLQPPPKVVAATQAYREEMDVLAKFLEECCVIDKDARAKASTLYQAYTSWREDNGERAEPQRKFGQRLAERGYQKRRSGATGAWVWYGLGLLELNKLNELNSPEPIFGKSSREGLISEKSREKVQYRSVSSVGSVGSVGDDDIPFGEPGTDAADAAGAIFDEEIS